MPDVFIHSHWNKELLPEEVPLRPHSFDQFVGQDHIKECLSISLRAAQQRKEPLGHCLLHGPPGLGKTTLASILAHEMGKPIVFTSGPSIEKPKDLVGILTQMDKGSLLFIDEIHRLPRHIEEFLYPALESFFVDLVGGEGSSARPLRIAISPFTLVGATTQSGQITSPLHSRFSLHHTLKYYSVPWLKTILLRSAKILKIQLNPQAATFIAQRSRGTPRIANRLLSWVRDFALIHQHNPISEEIAAKALQMLHIDTLGLEEMDIKLLETIAYDFAGGPVGLNSLAASVGTEPLTISEVYEPYLLIQGLLQRTLRGRKITTKGLNYLKKRQI